VLRLREFYISCRCSVFFFLAPRFISSPSHSIQNYLLFIFTLPVVQSCLLVAFNSSSFCFLPCMKSLHPVFSLLRPTGWYGRAGAGFCIAAGSSGAPSVSVPPPHACVLRRSPHTGRGRSCLCGVVLSCCVSCGRPEVCIAAYRPL
jgi:hypothetical protein